MRAGSPHSRSGLSLGGGGGLGCPTREGAAMAVGRGAASLARADPALADGSSTVGAVDAAGGAVLGSASGLGRAETAGWGGGAGSRRAMSPRVVTTAMAIAATTPTPMVMAHVR